MNFCTESIKAIALQIKTGKTPSTGVPEYFNGEINWYTPTDLSKETYLGKSSRTITEKAILENKATVFDKDTVLISCIGDIGKLGIVTECASSNQQITGVKLNKKVFPLFFYYWCKRNKSLLVNKSRQAILPILNNEILGQIKITYPETLDDQIRIATVLTRAEKLISKRKESIKALDELLKSTFLEMFGDPVRNEKGWEYVAFESVVKDFRNGQSPATAGILKRKVFTLTAITGNCFKGNEYKTSTFVAVNDNSIVKNDDFLICRGNGNINLVGRSAIIKGITEKIIFPDTMICANIDVDKLDLQFTVEMWKLPFIRRQIEQFARTTNGTYKINQQSLKCIMIIVPPKKLQTQFAVIVEKIESLKSKYTQSLTELENLYGSLSQRAFKGELDLSGVVVEKDEEVEEMNAGVVC